MTNYPQAGFFLKRFIINERICMRRFLLYVFLPGVVLGVVYQAGHNAGVESSAVDRPAPVVVPESAAPVAKSVAKPAQAPVAKPASAPVAKPAPASVAKSAPAPVAKSAPVPVAKPAAAPVARPAFVGNAPLEPDTAWLAQRAAESSEPLRIPRYIETDDGVVPVSYSAPVAPVPTRSVYDRRPADVSSLAPLQPLTPAAVYPGAQAPRTTFKEPVPVPVRSVSPIRITSSSECDCEKEPVVRPVSQLVSPLPVTSVPCSCGCGGGCVGGK